MSVLDEARGALGGLRWSEAAPRVLPVLGAPAAPLRSLRRALRKAQRPVLVVNDATRAQPRDLAVVVQDLWEGAGSPPIVVATGSHQGRAGVVRDRLNGLPVELHDGDDERAHVELGEGEGSVRIDRRVAKADLILAFGLVEPHYFAGWGGAHKTATIGALQRSSIEQNHLHALSAQAQPLALEGNPVFDDVARLCGLLEEDRRLFAVNHVLDGSGRPVGMAAGTWRGSLERSLRAARARHVHAIPARVDVLVAQVRGSLARSLYQADKGLKNNELAVKDGGDLVLVASLEEGVGPDRFVQLLREAPDHATALRRVEAEYRLGDHKAVRWRALEARGVHVRVVSPNLTPEAVEGAGITLHDSLAGALEAIAAEGRGASGEGLVVEDAALLVCSVGG